MKVYEQEIRDGIAEKVQANAFQICAPIQCAQAQLDEDLYPLKSILVSTGWNKNMDVFDKAETWNARHTPVNKKINFQHDELKIIGHITNSYVAGEEYIPDGTPLDQVPDEFNIITEGVLYTYWKDPERKQLMASIIGGIPDDWYVSMECLFDDFDYAVKNGDKTEVIKRDESTAYMTKFLSAFGGSGEYMGKPIGRLLRNFTFSGKGIVSNPANPKSVILDEDEENENEESAKFEEFANSSVSNHKGETIMSDESKALKEAQDEIKNLKEQLAAIASKELEKTIKQLETQLSTASLEKETAIAENDSLQNKITATEQALENLRAQLAQSQKEQEELIREKAETVKASKVAERTHVLVEAGLEREEAEVSAKKWIDVADEVFSDFVAAMKKRCAKDMKKDMKESQCEVVDPVKTLETAEPVEATVVPTEATDNADTIQAIAEYAKSFLKTAKKESK